MLWLMMLVRQQEGLPPLWNLLHLFSEVPHRSLDYQEKRLVNNITSMSVLLIVGPKCMLAALYTASWWVTVSVPMVQTDRQTYHYIMLSTRRGQRNKMCNLVISIGVYLISFHQVYQRRLLDRRLQWGLVNLQSNRTASAHLLLLMSLLPLVQLRQQQLHCLVLRPSLYFL